ncbi:unnamed protein product [Gadus morhua 'NCC']
MRAVGGCQADTLRCRRRYVQGFPPGLVAGGWVGRPPLWVPRAEPTDMCRAGSYQQPQPRGESNLTLNYVSVGQHVLPFTPQPGPGRLLMLEPFV